jgi:hypothetical protein
MLIHSQSEFPIPLRVYSSNLLSLQCIFRSGTPGAGVRAVAAEQDGAVCFVWAPGPYRVGPSPGGFTDF